MALDHGIHCRLAVTGYFNALPSIQVKRPRMFWMGWIRLIHFTTAYILLSRCCFVFTGRVGNEYAGDVSGSVLAPRTAQRRYQRNPAGIFRTSKRGPRYWT